MPGLDVLLAQGTHAVVEFALVTCMSTGNSATRTKQPPCSQQPNGGSGPGFLSPRAGPPSALI